MTSDESSTTSKYLSVEFQNGESLSDSEASSEGKIRGFFKFIKREASTGDDKRKSDEILLLERERRLFEEEKKKVFVEKEFLT